MSDKAKILFNNLPMLSAATQTKSNHSKERRSDAGLTLADQSKD
jgi:hypothetical protein